jgi:cell volume regulation protein A
VDEILSFGTIVLVVAGGFLLALLVIKLTERFPIPSPALFLLVAAVISDVFPEINDHLSVKTAERIGVVALILILFDGGMHVGWKRFRRSALPIGTLGILGTFATAGVVAVAAHYLFDFGWIGAWIVGAAVAPTDPAVMFSVLGNREVGGRSATILEGESGANDPVGIALMIAILDYATSSHGSLWTGVADFAVSMAVGLAVGVVGAVVLMNLMRRVSLPGEGLYSIRTLVFAFLIYGVATIAHGSGFLAVFVAGLLISDVRAPFKGEIENFHKSLASLGEIAVFAVLGLTIHLSSLGPTSVWLDGLVIALLLAFVVRPLVVAPLLAAFKLRLGERIFVMWGGLKGAVPILLGILVLLESVNGATRVYGIIFVVVTFSVVVQGSTMPFLARRLRVPMRLVVPTPWDVSIRLRSEPRTVRRYNVVETSRALGKPISDLPLGDRSWISMLIRKGQPEQPRGSTELEPGDELLVLSEPEDEQKLAHLFEGRR